MVPAVYLMVQGIQVFQLHAHTAQGRCTRGMVLMVKVSEPAGEIWKAALEGESKIKLRGTPRVDILCQASLLAAWHTGRLDSQVYASELQLLGTGRAGHPKMAWNRQTGGGARTRLEPSR